MYACDMGIPHFRDPRSFSDVFAVLVLVAGLTTLVLFLTDSQVRAGLFVVFVAVVVWVLWAVGHILERSRPH